MSLVRKIPQKTIRKLGVLELYDGAGIAYVSANNGIDVILIDQSQEAANKIIESINQLLNDGIKRGKITTAKKDEIINRIIPTDDYSMLAGSDLVVEAVFEDTKVKESATKRAQQYIDDKTIFIPTPPLPIGELAEASVSKEDFIGIHFFSPVHKMALVK